MNRRFESLIRKKGVGRTGRRKRGILLALPLLAASFCAEGADKPDILFILADDMSYEALGAARLLDIDTPNLDRLAEHGTMFTCAYNMGSYSPAVCIASRAMLNSGRFVWNATPSSFVIA